MGCSPSGSSVHGDSRGKNTGVGCHFLLQCVNVKSESKVPQSCPTLSDPMDCSLPGSSVHGIFQARVLEWGALAFSAFKPMHMLKKKKSLKHRCFYDYTVTKMAKIRSVILSVGKDLSYITDGNVKWCGSFGKLGFPGGSDGKESACNAGDLGSIPGFGRSPGGEHGNPLQYSCLENPHGQRSLVGYSPWVHR